METGRLTADRVPSGVNRIVLHAALFPHQKEKKKNAKGKEESKISGARGTCKVAGQKEMESERLVRSNFIWRVRFRAVALLQSCYVL